MPLRVKPQKFLGMTIPQQLQAAAVVLMLAAGQILFRKAALAVPSMASWQGLRHLAINPLFLVALVIYGAATLLWVGVLQQVPLSRAYGFMALSFVIVPAAAVMLLGEAFSLRLGVGLALILAGLAVLGGRA